jgi:hypothetical protein
MYFLQVGNGHHKNDIGFELLAREANATLIKSTDSNYFKDFYDLVWIPQGFYHNLDFPNAKRIIFGPHNFVFPTQQWLFRFDPPFDRSIYTCLSEYIRNLYKQFGTFCMPLEPLPFPVDIERFKPLRKEIKYDCFIYFKSRSHSRLRNIEEYLHERNITFITIICGKYKEEEYLEILNQVKFGLWFGAHESQGFALQEALSMNVPLLVLNITSLNDEINGEGNHSYLEYKDHYDLSATTTPYWDDRCGLQCYDINNLKIQLNKMLEIYMTFQPRIYVLENLSAEVCLNRIMTAFDKHLTPEH